MAHLFRLQGKIRNAAEYSRVRWPGAGITAVTPLVLCLRNRRMFRWCRNRGRRGLPQVKVDHEHHQDIHRRVAQAAGIESPRFRGANGFGIQPAGIEGSHHANVVRDSV